MEIENSFTKKDNLLFLEELLKTHKEKIKCIYIDPPFTTKRKFNNKKGEFAYEDKMDDDNFLHFLEQRISIAYHLLSSDGFFFLHIDNKIGHYVKILLDQIFGKENFITDLNPLYKKSDKKPYWHNLEASGQGEGKYFNGVFIEPSNGNHWRWSQERIDQEIKNGKLRINKKGKPEYLVMPSKTKIDNN